MSQARPNFRSDNVTGVASEILAALASANAGAAAAYGADHVTARLQQRFSEVFETECFVQPLATGTATNALALALLSPPYGAIYCSEAAHIHGSECGAGEFFTGGAKVVPLAAEHGRLDAAAVRDAIADAGRGQTHRVQPAVLSLTQASERGTVYPLEQVREIASTAREEGLRVHMDGARFANAVAALGCSPADLTWRAGVDVLSFGATKNGALAAEALVVFDPALIEPLRYRARRAGQIFSKMRFISAQLEACVEDGLWLRLAANANAMAARLAAGLGSIDGIDLLHPVDINELFLTMPQPMIDGLLEAGFGLGDYGGGEVRLVTAFDTRPADVDAFVAAARALAR
jgi:threonine aldolase